MPNTVEYKEYLFVKVMPNARDFGPFSNKQFTYTWKGDNGHTHYTSTGILPGSWQIIGKGDDPVVYEQVFPDENGFVVLKSLGMGPSETLILKKNEK